MRRFLALALAAASALALASAGSAESGGALTPVGGAVFPDRAFVLSLPTNTYLGAEDLQVRENGDVVEPITVTPTRAADAGSFGVVLVIDASSSMRGAPIQGAVAAARAFAAQRAPTQQVAIVTFNSSARTILPFTTDPAQIEQALEQPPPLARGTYIYDAVDTALVLLANAQVTAGSVVLLSDGADSGSQATAAEATARSRAAHVRIFTVGLRGRAFSPETLAGLAAGSGAAYSAATSPSELKNIFEALGGQLANEYLIQYRSKADPSRTIHVSVAVNGLDGVFESTYQTPAGAVGHTQPFHRSFAERFWRSTAGMVATSFGVAAFLALALALILRQPRRTLRKRMAEFVTLAQPAREEEAGSSGVAPPRPGRPLAKSSWWIRFEEELELADIRTPATHIVAGTALLTVLAMWILAVVGGTPLLSALGLAVPFFVRAAIKRKLERKRRLFADQLPDNLQVLSSALRAGHSLVGALSVVVEDCPEPSCSEFRRIIADEQLGVPLETAFTTVSQRMANRDLEQVALVATLQRETGGNTAEVLDRVADTVRSRFELRRLVNTLTTQGRMSRWVVSLLPVGLLALITAINPGYMEPLYTHVFGRVLLVVAAVMVVAGSLVIKRIIDIKV
jgi:tight adherence protein B